MAVGALVAKHMAKNKGLPVVKAHVQSFVSKHMGSVNKSTVEVDRRKADKRGYSKHRKNYASFNEA